MGSANNGHVKEVKAKDVTSALDDGAGAAEVMGKFYPLIIESAFHNASLAGLPVSFTLDNPFVQTVLKRLAKDIKGVAETTKEEIRGLVGNAAEHGWSTEQLRKAIIERALIAAGTPEEAGTRANAIARTELARGHSLGSLAAYEASGVVESVEWLVSDDPCPECQGLGGKVVKLNAEFADGIIAPPAHPRCTCALSPIVSKD